MFLDRARFPFLAELEGSWRAVRAESEALGAEDYSPWVYGEASVGGWGVFPLLNRGLELPENPWDLGANARRCPHTAELVRSIPGAFLAAFSRLEGGAHILPHQDYLSPATYRAHLALVIPGDGGIRAVGGMGRNWHEGSGFVFDGSVRHEAANLCEHPRVVLLVDVRSELYP
ncbi:MAG: aspartyl/asparaginyl beta-hydroxylase domain-containing protein [Planctomycetota bacterium]